MRAMAKLNKTGGAGCTRRRKVKEEVKSWGNYPGESCVERARSNLGERTATLRARL